MNPLHSYLQELQAVRASGAGVKETSYYPAASGLFNAVGKTLKPAVRCIINFKNTGAGIPDGGFFTPDQVGKGAEDALRPGLMPSRGVLEVKGTGDDVAKIAASEQVDKYWVRYGQVLVTNLRDFVLVGRNENGQGGVTMPGKGKSVERAYTADEAAALGEGGPLLGETTRDIYLNPVACWRNVPARVWDYTLGGYQVMKKWLSYREHALLGRDLTPDEAREVTAMARRLAALRLLEPALDAAYQAVKAAAWDLTPAQVPTLP